MTYIAMSHVPVGAGWTAGLVNQMIDNIASLAGGSSTTFRKNTPTTVNTSTSEVDLLTGTTGINIPANTMTANSTMRGRIIGDFLQQSGGATGPPRFKLKLGATTLLDTGVFGAGTLGSTSSRCPWVVDFLIVNQALTNSQFVGLTSWAAGNSSPTTGEGQLVGGGAPSYQWYIALSTTGATSVDMTVAQALQYTVINPSGSATYETKAWGALIEVI